MKPFITNQNKWSRRYNANKKIYNTNEINTIQMKLIQYKWNIYNANEIYTIQISNIQYKWN